MITVVFLKILSDLGFYMTFAGFVAAFFGARTGMLLAAVLAPALALTLSYPLRDIRLLRLVPGLLPLGLFLLFRGRAEWIPAVPPVLYGLYLAWARVYEPDRESEQEILGLFWKLFLGFSLLCVFVSRLDVLASALVPLGAVTFTALVLLTRSLRHEPEVYRTVRYQLLNLALVAAVGLMAAFLGSPFFLHTLAGLLKLVYDYVIAPLLMGFIYLLLGVIRAVIFLVKLLPRKEKPEEEQETFEMKMEGMRELLGEEEGEPMDFTWLRRILLSLLIIGVSVALFFLFRYLARRRGDSSGRAAGITDERVSLDAGRGPDREPEETSSVGKVRQVYRRFLRLCARRGYVPYKSDTSLDVNRKYAPFLPEREKAELRELYLAARYDGRAGRAEAARARELYNRMKSGKE